MMKNKFKKALQAAVILSCATLFPWQAMAAEVEEVEYEVFIGEFKYGDQKYFTVEVVDAGQKTEDGITRELEDDEIEAFEKQAVVYLGDITGVPVIAPVIGLTPLDIKDSNASAVSEIYENGLTQYASYFVGNGVSEESDENAAEVTVNLAHEGSSWYTTKYPILPTNGIDADYAGTIVHEMVHAMGVGCYNLEENEEDANKKYLDFNKSLKFTAGLYDAFGRNAQALANANSDNTLPIEKITVQEYESFKQNILNESSDVPESDTFYIINDATVGFYGGVYFSGDNVLDVLNGAEIAWPNGIALNAVHGIPIECYEGEKLDLSHLELQNGLMSHQDYRNWCTLMEAELAVLQDIGFGKIEDSNGNLVDIIDRSKFFGQSIYESGKIITLDSLRNDKTINDGWSSATDRAIGLHIYGSNNKVTLADTADITASGSYSMGVRVDGRQNDLIIASGNTIAINGLEGNGIVVAYGKNHNVSIANGASVTATGDGGIGVRFDFGSNEMGDWVEYRGSYIRGKYDEEQGEFTNLAFAKTSALAGALVDTFNVNGTLSGEKAIYISPNALVKNINIGVGATVAGDIISEWNPEGVEYFYTRKYDGENPYEGLKPNIQLATGETLDNYRTNLNFNGNRTFSDNIIGPFGINLNINSGTLTTANKNTNIDGLTGVSVNSVNVANGATYNLDNTLTVGAGYGVITVNGEFALDKDGRIISSFNNEKVSDASIYNQSTTIVNNGEVDFAKGSLVLVPRKDYYNDDIQIKILNKATANANFGNLMILDVDRDAYKKDDGYYIVSPTLEMSAVQGELYNRNNDNSIITISTNRTMENIALNKAQCSLGEAYVNDSEQLVEANDDWENVYTAIDFSAMDGSGVRQAFDQLLPSSYGYGAMATMDLHRMLSDFSVGGSLAPAHNVKEKGKWHNIVIPYASETDHIKNGTGYKNNHSGMVGAMERTLDDVTVGWHAALNHQSTNGAEIGRLKGDGLYLGAQVKYAPKAWNGWGTFGIARVGIEDFEMQRNFNFNGYNSKVDSDFTAFSGSLRVGGAYEKEAKEMTFGPFAALDYAFAHHPSIEEDGAGAGRLSVESGTYDSLRTQLGYRLQTAPKHLEDRTYWQANAAIAWNHELLGDAGNVSASFRDFGGTTFGCDVNNYGRDSLSLMAGMTFKNPSKLDVTFNLGTDIYRHGGNTLYAKCALEWKF